MGAHEEFASPCNYMCGIAGFVGRGDAPILRAMESSLAHRGPDSSAIWLSPEGTVGLMHRRLAIIDLSPDAAQPMHSHDGRFSITFNGEIYNFKALREELTAYPFSTESDTEVILAAYAAWGVESFKKLHGMFAFALYDSQTHELFLVRDRLGKKPLYWTHASDIFLFGSELKALRAHPSCPHEVDTRSMAEYLARDYVPTPHTIYKDIHKLLPGSFLRFSQNKVHTEPFWSPVTLAPAMSEEDALEKFDALLTQAVEERLIADVPLGVFLSGGIDSSTVAYYASKIAPGKVKTFSIGFAEESFDESRHARTVAAHLGTEHHEKILSAQDALKLIREIPMVFDEPVADASVLPTLLLSQFTREHVTVALGGDGADELLLGYPTFKAEKAAAFFNLLPQAARSLLGKGVDFLPASQKYLGLDVKARKFTHDFDPNLFVRHLQWLGSFRENELLHLLTPAAAATARGITHELIAQWRSEAPSLSGLNALSHFYMRTYLMDEVLVKVDRASMHYGLEVRAPFLSHELVEFLLALPPQLKYQGGGKYLLKKLMRGRLPDSILDRSKQGFAAPTAAWLRTDLRELLIQTLSKEKLTQNNLLQYTEVKKLIDEHLAGKRNHAKKLWTILVFQLWLDTWHPTS